MVAGQDRDAVAALDAHRQQSVGDRVGGIVEFPESDRAVVVDDGGRVRGPTRVERGNHAELAPPADVGEHRRDVLRRLELAARPASNILRT